MPNKVVEITCTADAPRTHTFGQGDHRVKIRPGRPTYLSLDAAQALEGDDHFRRAFHGGCLAMKLVEDGEQVAKIDHGPDPLPPPPVLGAVNDVGVFLTDKAKPVDPDTLSPESRKTLEVANARGITVEQLVAQRTENARRQSKLAEAAAEGNEEAGSTPVIDPGLDPGNPFGDGSAAG